MEAIFMFDSDRKPKSGDAKPGTGKPVRHVSASVVFSCYIASAAIIAISAGEAIKSFGADETGRGKFYILLAVLGLFFSVFITVMNNRNKKLLEENDRKGKIAKK